MHKSKDKDTIEKHKPYKPAHDLTVYQQKKIVVQTERTVTRLNARNLVNEVAASFNLERGFLYTFKMMTINPSRLIREYLDTGRYIVTNPVKYFLLIVGLVLFIAVKTDYFSTQSFVEKIESSTTTSKEDRLKGNQGIIHIESDSGEVVDREKEERIISNIVKVYQEYFVGYQNAWSVFFIFFISLFSWLFFIKSGYNFIENIVANSYVFTHSYVIFGLIVIFNLSSKVWMLMYLLYFIGLTIMVYKNLFKQSWGRTVTKTLFATLLAGILYLTAMLGGTLLVVWLTIERNVAL